MSGGEIKQDEKYLWSALMHRRFEGYINPMTDEIANKVAEKRLNYILEKWERKGLWEYGVSTSTGWFTQRAIEGE